QEVRQPSLALGPVLARPRAPARRRDRHPAAENACAGASYARLKGQLGAGGDCQPQGQALPGISRGIDRRLAQEARALEVKRTGRLATLRMIYPKRATRGGARESRLRRAGAPYSVRSALVSVIWQRRALTSTPL